MAIVTGGARGIVSPSARNITGHDVPVDAGLGRDVGVPV
jgi:hypothetical protein